MPKRVRITFKNGIVTVTDLDTNKVVDNIIGVGFEHRPNEKPAIILQIKAQVEEYVLETRSL